MTLAAVPRHRFADAAAVPGRDPLMDLVRAACLLVVVALHAFMAGITVGPTGLQITNALESWNGFDAASWVVQVMPLFFVVGGFAAARHLRRDRARGRSATDYRRARLHRLAAPALLAFATITAGLALASLLGVGEDLLATLGFRLAQPLWFLGVYLGASALVPVLLRAHERAPRLSLGVLIAAALTVDVVRAVSGIEALGFLNLAFVWLAIQQIGFFWADGAFREGSTAALIRLLLVGLGGAALLIAAGLSPINLIDALNPPTSVLIGLGLAQAALLARWAPSLRIGATRPRATALTRVLSRHSLGVYLWHMPVLVLVALGMLAAGLPWPEPISAGWWLSRPLWLLTIAVVLALALPLLARTDARISRLLRPVDTLPGPLTSAAIVLATGGVVVVLLSGYSPLGAPLGCALLIAGLLLGRGRLHGTRVQAGEAGITTPAS